MKKLGSQVKPFIRHPHKLFSKKYAYEYLLIVVLGIAIFFRFYNTPARYVMDMDPTRDALINIVGSNQIKFPQLGPTSGRAPFNFGPWYYYQTIIFSIITPFDYAPWIYIGITSVITIYVFFLIGYFLEDKKFGLILASIAALSPAELGPITGLSNPNLIPIQASLALLFFVLFFKKKMEWYWIILWGIIIGIGINNHYQAVGLLFLPLVGFIAKPKRFFINGIEFTAGLIISFVPLLLFDIGHNWRTVHGFLIYITSGRVATPDRWMTYLLDFWPKFSSYVLGVTLFYGLVSFIFVTVILGLNMVHHKVKSIYYWLFVVFILNFIFLRYATTVRENYYFIYLHGLLFVLFGYAVWLSLKNKYSLILCLFLLIGMVSMILKEDIRRLKSEEIVTSTKNQVLTLEKKYPQEKFIFYSCGDRSRAQTQAMVFFAYNEHYLDDHGKKIGIASDDCYDTDIHNSSSKNGVWGYTLLDQVSSQNLKKYWIKTTPESVYKEFVK